MRARRGQLVLGAAAAALLLAIVAFAASSNGIKGVPDVATPRPTPATVVHVIARRDRTGEFPPRSFVTIRRVHPGGLTLHQRFQRHRGLVVSPYEPVLIGGRTAESFTVAYPSGARRREIVLGDGLVVDLLGASRRDLKELAAPAAELLRSEGLTTP